MRIQSGIGGAGALRELQRSFLDISRLQDRLSSGRRLQGASDGPASLVLSERLRSELAALNQAGENVSRLGGVLNTADGAYAQASDLLVRGQALALGAAGASSPEELGAYQGEMDSIVDSLRRLGGSVSFGSQRLTDGSQGFTVGNADPALDRIEVRQTRDGFAPSTVTVDVTAAATRGQASGALAAAQAGEAEIQVTGASGTATVRIGDQSTRAETAAAINAVKETTGVEADAATGVIRATAYGSDAFVDLRSLSGTLTGVAEGRTEGTDVAATVDGVSAPARANVLDFSGSSLSARITLEDGTGPGAYAFDVTGGGYRFQAGTSPGDAGVLGLPSILPTDLGRDASALGLQSVATGGANSLAANPSGAAAVFASALDDLGRARGQLGALQQRFDSVSGSLQVTFENLSASESRIGDTDFASTLAELSTARIRNQAALSVQAQASRLQAGNVLRLLGAG